MPPASTRPRSCWRPFPTSSEGQVVRAPSGHPNPTREAGTVRTAAVRSRRNRSTTHGSVVRVRLRRAGCVARGVRPVGPDDSCRWDACAGPSVKPLSVLRVRGSSRLPAVTRRRPVVGATWGRRLRAAGRGHRGRASSDGLGRCPRACLVIGLLPLHGRAPAMCTTTGTSDGDGAAIDGPFRRRAGHPAEVADGGSSDFASASSSERWHRYRRWWTVRGLSWAVRAATRPKVRAGFVAPGPSLPGRRRRTEGSVRLAASRDGAPCCRGSAVSSVA